MLKDGMSNGIPVVALAGTIEALDEDSAWKQVEENYYTGSPENDDNLYLKLIEKNER